ncbi:hypothetical protein RSC2_02661 [Bacillus paralicheniformis]|nr:hypothetical protein RSC2_02661 [Bacillus paralicheniformis]BCE17095.1 hypothetical protein RSC3_04451 [Bacillus paralicheniformis]
MLQVKQASKIYEGKIAYRALTDINLTIDKGEFVGIMGPSGSGKTTLLNMIATIDEPTTGEILISGQNPHVLKKKNWLNFAAESWDLCFRTLIFCRH